MLDLAITWLPIIGGVLFGLGVAIWGFPGGSKTYAIWIGFAGAVVLAFGFCLHLQKIAWTEDGPKVDEGKRAYVYFVDGDVVHADGSSPTMTVVIQNTGQSPAHELTWRAKFEVRGASDGGLVQIEPEVKGAPQTLAPGARLSYQFTFPEWPPQVDDFIANEKSAIFSVGEIRYKDIYGIDRYTDYRLISGGRFGIKTGISPGKFGMAYIKSN